jgi:DNA ligase (NAD+)
MELINNKEMIIMQVRDKNKNYMSNVPIKCSVCDSYLETFRNGAKGRCVNFNCPTQFKKRLRHWCSSNAMDIRGVGKILVDDLVDKKIVKKLTDLYTLEKKHLVKF